MPLASVPALGLRLGASLRSGGLPQNAGNTLTFAPSAGVALRLLQPSEGRRLGASARIEYLVVDQQVTRGSTTKATWPPLSGVGGTVDVEVRAAESVDVVIGLGLEEVFSPTYVYVGAEPAAELSATRVTAEAGVRLGL